MLFVNDLHLCDAQVTQRTEDEEEDGDQGEEEDDTLEDAAPDLKEQEVFEIEIPVPAVPLLGGLKHINTSCFQIK